MPGFLFTSAFLREGGEFFFWHFTSPAAHWFAKLREVSSTADSGPITARHFKNPKNGSHDGDYGCANRKTTRSPTKISKNGRKQIAEGLPPLRQKRKTKPKESQGTHCPDDTTAWNKLLQRFDPKGSPKKAFTTLFMFLNTIGERKLGQFSRNKIRPTKITPEAT